VFVPGVLQDSSELVLCVRVALEATVDESGVLTWASRYAAASAGMGPAGEGGAAALGARRSLRPRRAGVKDRQTPRAACSDRAAGAAVAL